MGFYPSELFPLAEPLRLSAPDSVLTFTTFASTRAVPASYSLFAMAMNDRFTNPNRTDPPEARLNGFAPCENPLPTNGG